MERSVKDFVFGLLLVVGGSILHGQTKPVVLYHSRPDGLTKTKNTVTDTAQITWVSHYQSNRASRIDVAHDVVLDGQGNVFVTGKSEGSGTANDYLTVKYDFSGNEVWRARYDGPGHGVDIANAIALDSEGNVYVTGLSSGNGQLPDYWPRSAYDFCTIKYNSGGKQEWVARYDGPGNSTDAAIAMAVDAAGNVYVTGESVSSDTGWTHQKNYDFATVKYNTTGTLQWVARYDGPANSDDAATAIALDSLGDLYVTGWSIDTLLYGFDQHFSYATIKYDANGAVQWIERYSRSQLESASPVAMVVDRSGSVIVSGQTGNGFLGVNSGYIATVKYDPNGNLQWAVCDSSFVNARVTDLVLDGGDNAIIAATSLASASQTYGISVLVLKYASNGALQWKTNQGGNGNKITASGIGVDTLGNVFLSGFLGQEQGVIPSVGDSLIVLKYDSDGLIQWVNTYSNPGNSTNMSSAMTVDDVGNVLVVGSDGQALNSSFVTIKYAPSGPRQWVARTTGSGSSNDVITAMKVDAGGNVYIAGKSFDANTSWDYFTAKFNTNGEQVWEARYNGPDSRSDYANAIAIDNVGNVYVTGTSGGKETSNDWATIKYSKSGVEQWVTRYNSGTGLSDEASRLVIDGEGNVYVAGLSASGTRMTTIKYDNSGVQLWIAHYDSLDNVRYPTEILIDNVGNLYTTGFFYRGWTSIGRTVKYNSSGVQQWAIDGADDIAVDDSGYVYATGGYMHGTAKYTPSGVLVWGTGAGGHSLLLDQDGSVFVQSFYAGSIGKIIGGTLQWEVVPISVWFAYGFCLDSYGSAYISGYGGFSSDGTLPYSAKVNTSGIVEWMIKYRNTDNAFLIPAVCQVDPSGNLYVAGSSQRSDFTNSPTIIKYSQVTVSVDEPGQSIPEKYSLSQNYPNPFNPSTEIRFRVAAYGLVNLMVFDVLGREVATLVDDKLSPGSYSAEWNARNAASGVYFYRLTAGDFVETRKMVLMK